jgi:hypothetical protein
MPVIQTALFRDYAGLLIDLIYEEINTNTTFDFAIGLTGIGWGLITCYGTGLWKLKWMRSWKKLTRLFITNYSLITIMLIYRGICDVILVVL